LRKKIFLQS
jgi:hypothetical protein